MYVWHFDEGNLDGVARPHRDEFPHGVVKPVRPDSMSMKYFFGSVLNVEIVLEPSCLFGRETNA